ncbi:MAG: ParA family protein [Vibrio sp.]
MGKIVSIANQKGGVGKTTTSVNLAAALADIGKKVLLIDLDPQGNATTSCGIDKYDLQATAYDLLVEETPFQDVVISLESAQFDLIASNGDVTAAEIKLAEFFAREMRLKNALSPVIDQYDFIFIDCPPSLNLLTVNALAASHSVMIPMQCEYFALEGLTALMDTVQKLASAVNQDLKIEGILRTMFDPRNRLSNDVSAQLKEYFGDALYRSVIPRNVRLAEAPSHGLAAIHYDKYSAGAKAYVALAHEVLKRQEQHKFQPIQ